jgi:hypothetical protein
LLKVTRVQRRIATKRQILRVTQFRLFWVLYSGFLVDSRGASMDSYPLKDYLAEDSFSAKLRMAALS